MSYDVIKAKIIALERELTQMCDEFEIEKPAIAATPRFSLCLNIDKALVGKIKSIIMRGYSGNMTTIIEDAFIKKIEEVELERGVVAPVDPQTRLPHTGRNKSTTSQKAHRVIKKFGKQISLLKQQFDNQEQN